MPEPSPAEYGAGIVAMDIVMETADLRVSRFTLGPRGVLAWHRHTEIVDYFVCLSGMIEIETRDPTERVELRPGDEFRVDAGTAHEVRNPGEPLARYLIVQGVGTYDRIPAPPSAEE